MRIMSFLRKNEIIKIFDYVISLFKKETVFYIFKDDSQDMRENGQHIRRIAP